MLFAAVHKSAIGTKRTSSSALHMSAFDPKRTLASAPIAQNRGPSARPGYELKTPVLSLWTGVAWLALGAKDIAVEIGDPPPSVRRDVEVAHGALDMSRYAAPIKLRI